MSSRSLVEMTKCRWREFRREPSGFFWVIFMPVFGMVVLGLAFSKPRPERYGVGIMDRSDPPQIITDVLTKNDQIKAKSGSKEELDTWFKRGEIVIGLQVNSTEEIVYLYDSANPESVRARRYVDDLLQRHAGRRDVISTADVITKSEGGRYVDFLIPGLLAFSIMSSSLFGIAMTIVSNRKENLLKRYLATPMRKHEFLISHIFGRIMVLAFEFGAIMIAGYLLFKFVVFGNLASYLGMSVLGAAAFTAIAMVCASRTASIPMTAGLLNLISIPMMLFSGVFFSRSNFPDWMHGFINILPLTALADGLRKIALEGLSILDLGYEVTLLSVYAVLATLLARFLFRWY